MLHMKRNIQCFEIRPGPAVKPAKLVILYLIWFGFQKKITV